MEDPLDPSALSTVLQNDLIQDQLDRLDPDLAARVVLAGVSLSVTKMLKELSLANQLMLGRFIEKEKGNSKPFSESEQKRLDDLQAMFMRSYNVKGSIPN